MRSPPVPSSRASSLLFLVLGLPFLLAGIGLLVAAPLTFIKERAFRSHAELTTGTVERFQSESRYNGGGHTTSYQTTYYKPVYTFTDRAGQKHTAVSNDESRDRPAYKVGQSVPVLYDPADPDVSHLDTVFSSWGKTLSYVGVGVVLTAGCLWLAVGCVRGLRGKSNSAADAPRDPAILSGP